MRTNIKKYISIHFLGRECGFSESFFIEPVNTSFQYHFYGFFSHHANLHFTSVKWRATHASVRILLSKFRYSIAYIFDKTIVLE